MDEIGHFDSTFSHDRINSNNINAIVQTSTYRIHMRLNHKYLFLEDGINGSSAGPCRCNFTTGTGAHENETEKYDNPSHITCLRFNSKF